MDYQAQRKAQAAVTRRTILEAAAQLVQEVGFDKMSIRDVCQRAGVTTGAFYHHFASKEELLSQGFSTLDDFLEEELADTLDEPPIQHLERLLQSYAKYVEHMGWQNLALYYSRRIGDPTSAHMSPKRYTLRAMVDCFEELSRQGVLSPAYTPQWTADLCFRHFRGVVVDWILHQGTYPLWPKLEQDYALFFKALSE